MSDPLATAVPVATQDPLLGAQRITPSDDVLAGATPVPATEPAPVVPEIAPEPSFLDMEGISGGIPSELAQRVEASEEALQAPLTAIPSEGVSGEAFGAISRTLLPTPLSLVGVAQEAQETGDIAKAYSDYVTGKRDYASELLAPEGLESPVTTAMRTAAYVADLLVDPFVAGAVATGAAKRLTKPKKTLVDTTPTHLEEDVLNDVGKSFKTAEEARVVKEEDGLDLHEVIAVNDGFVVRPTRPIQDALAEQASLLERDMKSISGEVRLGEKLKGGLGRTALDIAPGSRSVGMLYDLAPRSKTAHELASKLEHRVMDTSMRRGDHFEKFNLFIGKQMTDIGDILHAVKGNPTLELDVVKALQGAKPANTMVKGYADRLRDTLDSSRNYINAAFKEAGSTSEVAYLENYFPRVYIEDAVVANRDEFRKLIMDYTGKDARQAENSIGNLLDENGIDTPLIRGSAGRKAFEHERTLAEIPDEELMRLGLIETRLNDIMTKYVFNSGKRAEHARIFGAERELLSPYIERIEKETAASGRPLSGPERAHLENQLEGISTALRTTRGRIHSPIGRRVNKLNTTYQYMRTLPLVTLTSLSELPLMLTRLPAKHWIKAIAGPAMDHAIRKTARKVFKNIPASEATKAIERMGIGLDAAILERQTALFGGDPAAKATTAFFKGIGLDAYTRYTRVVASEGARSMISDYAKSIAKGRVKGNELRLRMRKLNSLGITAEDISRGITPEQMDQAALRFTNEVIMHPRPTNKALWMSDANKQVFSMLKGYVTAYTNTILPAINREIRDLGVVVGTKQAAKILGALSLTLYTAYMTNAIRAVITGREEEYRKKKPEEKLADAFSRAAPHGAFSMMNDMFSASSYGSSPAEVLLGPTVSQVSGKVKRQELLSRKDIPVVGQFLKRPEKEKAKF